MDWRYLCNVHLQNSCLFDFPICWECISNDWMDGFSCSVFLLNRPFKWSVLQLVHFQNSPKGTATFFICDDISCIHVFTFPRNIEVSILRYYIFRVRRTLIKKDLDFRGNLAWNKIFPNGPTWTSYTQGIENPILFSHWI